MMDTIRSQNPSRFLFTTRPRSSISMVIVRFESAGA